MAQTMLFRIGADASCTDGACGQVSHIILNPVTREVTHLAVDPKHRHGPGRLVPVDLVDATTGQIRLRCPLAEFQMLRLAQETEGGPDLDPSGHGHPDNAPNKVNWVVVGGSVIMQPGGRGEPEAPQQVTRGHPVPRSDGDHLVRDDAEAAAKGLPIPGGSDMWVASPEPAVGVFTPAGTCQGSLGRAGYCHDGGETSEMGNRTSG